jgi:hypothetical protein
MIARRPPVVALAGAVAPSARRRAPASFAALAAALVLAGAAPAGCVPDEDKEPAWQKPPASFDPKAAELTFNAAGLEAFNALSGDDRTAKIEQMKAEKGSFKGQAQLKDGAALGDAMPDRELGEYELYAIVPEPVLYEITLEYRLYTTPAVGKPLPPNAYIQFQGTVAQVDFQADSKPRKLSVKVLADAIEILK